MKTTYSLMHELMADPVQPMPFVRKRHHLTSILLAMQAIERSPEPTSQDWCAVGDAIHMLFTLVKMGEVQDPEKLTEKAFGEMVAADKRNPIRFSGEGIQVIRAVVDAYCDAVGQLPERTIIRCHRLTEKELQRDQHRRNHGKGNKPRGRRNAQGPRGTSTLRFGPEPHQNGLYPSQSDHSNGGTA